MSADGPAQGAFDTLAEHLRQEIGQQVQNVLDELAAAARADRERAISDARDSVDRDAAARLTASVAEAETRARAEGHQAGHDAGHEEGFAAGQAEARAEVDQARAKADEARAEAEQARAKADASHAGAPPADPEGAERLADAIRAIGRARSLSEILDAAVESASREAKRAALFLVRGGRLKAWRVTGFPDADPAIEIPLDAAGIIGDVVRTNTVATGDSGGAPAFAALSTGACVAVPLSLGGDVVSVLYADEGIHPAWMTMVEVIGRHAARSLEAMTAFKTARAIMNQPAADASAAPAGTPSGGDEDASAQRYAKLLVSEIKLYHEAAVVAGRLEGDLGQRLSDEIGRARVLYEQRVSPRVRQRADYFHDELVRTLANGDSRLLA
jgi:hypothetical protein